MTGKKGMAGKKLQITLPAQIIEMLSALEGDTGMTSSIVIAMAIREMYQREMALKGGEKK